MRSIKFKISNLGFLVLLTFGGGFPLWAHEGEHNIDPLFLDIAKQPLKFEEIVTLNQDEKPVKLSDYQGEVIFLNFWATWCIPCREEMPDMQRLAEMFKDQLFKIVAVNYQETPSKIKNFYRKLKIQFDTFLDPQGAIFRLYGAEQLPTTYIIDQQGFIVARAIGARNWDSEESIDYFEHLLKEKE